MRENYVLNGRYRILHSLGEGGMANVYLAHDLILDRDVAVKLLRLDLRDDPKTNKRFQREALAATELVNPNIVSVYDVGEENGMNYLVMEYVSGMDLKNYIKVNFPIPYQEVINILEQVLSAVQVAHDHDIIHRDLKPQNILVDKNGQVKITDFGIAIALSEHSLTQTNTVLGSVHYLSPEQAHGGMATKKSDIYSLGIILYEMLTGKVPFDGETAVSIAIKHYQEDVPSVRDVDPRIPQALENVVLKATAKQPENRYESSQEMGEDLLTSLSDKRANEPKFIPHSNDLGETKVMPMADIKNGINQASPDEDSESKNKKPKTRKKKHRKLRYALLVIGFLFVLMFGLITWANQTQMIEVPDVTEMSEQTATRKIEAASLTVGSVSHKPSNSVKKDRIIKTNPRYGFKVKKNHKVNLMISSGVKKTTFRNYRGMQYKAVARNLRAKGFTVIRQNNSSDSLSAGQIMEQDIASGKKVVAKNTTVTFTVSTGQKQITLENLTGKTKKQINDYASENSINVYYSYEYSDTVDKNKAISQDPIAGTTIKQGSNVKISLSRGKQTDDSDSTDQFNVKLTIPFKGTDSSSSVTSDNSSSAESIGENIIYVYLTDSTHTYKTVYRQLTITKSTSITLPFTLKSGKSGGYKVVRDGQTIMSDNGVTKDNH